MTAGTPYVYLLDTNIISDMMRHPAGRSAERLAEVAEGSVCTSIIVAAEVRFGLARRASARLTTQAESILASIPILAFEPPADRCYGDIRNALARSGTPIGYNDLFVAAHALALGLTLVTDNTREFARVPALKVENWVRSEGR